MKQSFAKVLVKANASITVDQWVILEQLESNQELSQLDLAKLSFKDAPTVTRIIDLLENKGLVTRNPSQKDRRKFIISLSKEGINKVKAIKVIALEFRKQIYNGLNNKEIDKLKEMLDIINRNLIQE